MPRSDTLKQNILGRYSKPFAWDLLAATFSVFLFLLKNPDFGWRYSFHLDYLLQLEALLKGQLRILDAPYGMLHDWMWNQGAYQGWGLGVPLLIFPFHLLAKSLGWIGFPDRLHFLLFLGLTVFLLSRSLRVFLGAMNENSNLLPQFLAIWLGLYPDFLLITSARFVVYEQAIAYLYLASLISFSSLLLYLSNPTSKRLWFLCLTAGGLILIRPTGIFLGAPILICAWFLSPVGRRWMLMVGLWGCALQMILNQLRFSSPFEFGYAFNNSGVAPNEYALRFFNPYAQASVMEAIRELFAAIFLVQKIPEPYGLSYFNDIHPWFSQLIRFREFYFQTYRPFLLVILALSFLLWGIGVGRGRWKRLQWLWALAWLQILGLGAFYLYSPSITSRYFIDFSPAFACLYLGICIFFFISLKRLSGLGWGGLRYLVCLNFVLLGYFLMPVDAKNIFYFNPDYSSEQIEDRLKAFQYSQSIRPELPNSYECTPFKGSRPLFNIFYNGMGWDFLRTCGVGDVSVLYFKDPECIEILFEKNEMGFHEYPSAVKLGAQFLAKLTSDETEKIQTHVYCAKKPEEGFQILSIAWSKPKTVLRRHPIRLKRVSKLTRAEALAISSGHKSPAKDK